MTAEELKIRQLENQHLLQPASVRQAVGDLCGLQAQFLSNALHAIRIRSYDFEEKEAEFLMKSWTIRGTLHVFLAEDLPLFLHQGRKNKLRPCDTLEADDKILRERKLFFAEIILKEIEAGNASRDGLKKACAACGMTETEEESLFDPWGGTIRALCEVGRICHVVQEKKEFRLCPPFVPMGEDEARLELMRRYFTHYGPATIRDAAYFFGTAQAQVKSYLSRLPVESTDCEGRTFYYIPAGEGGGANGQQGIPACLFLAGFDPLMLGYQKTESLYLPGEYLRGIFNLGGIVMPAILLDGRVVGRWKKKGGKVELTLFAPLGRHDREKINGAARELWPGLTVCLV